MKLISVILSFAILLTGCYTHTAVTKVTPTVDDATLIFRLHNGSYITSEAGQYHRIENGYSVKGSLAVKDIPGLTDFSGVVRDDQIEDIVRSELNVGMTVVTLVLVGVVVLAGVVSSVSRGMSQTYHVK